LKRAIDAEKKKLKGRGVSPRRPMEFFREVHLRKMVFLEGEASHLQQKRKGLSGSRGGESYGGI